MFALFLGEPGRTQFDLNFSLAGIPVRVTPFFWVIAFALGYSDGQPIWLLMWIGAMFISILLHEMGHSFAFRRFGIDSHIVLYHFGGLAIPSSTFSSYSRFSNTGSLSPKQQIFISAAGPGVQLVLAAMIYAAVRLSSYSLFTGLPFLPREMIWGEFGELPLIPDENLRIALEIFFIINVYWALLNLLPVYPLDGGKIARELFSMHSPHAGIKNSLILSIATCAAIAIYAFSKEQPFLGIMFAFLGFSSFQALQAHTGGGGGFGGWRGGRGGGGW